MKKTHIAISILLVIALLYLMWFVGFSQGKKVGADKFASDQYKYFIENWNQRRGVEYIITQNDGSTTTIFIAPILDQEGQVVIKPK